MHLLTLLNKKNSFLLISEICSLWIIFSCWRLHYLEVFKSVLFTISLDLEKSWQSLGWNLKSVFSPKMFSNWIFFSQHKQIIRRCFFRKDFFPKFSHDFSQCITFSMCHCLIPKIDYCYIYANTNLY